MTRPMSPHQASRLTFDGARGDDQGGDRVASGPADQAVEPEPEQQEGGQVSVEQGLFGLCHSGSRPELTADAGHDGQADRSEH
jgi:hypothetical protein